MENLTLENEKLSANELVLLEQLVKRLNKECALEGRSQSDIRLTINYCRKVSNFYCA